MSNDHPDSGWRRLRIADVAKVSRGASPRPIASPRWFSDTSEIGWVRIADLGRSDGLTLSSTEQRLSPAGVARSRLLPPGTLIMSIAATVGLPIVTGIPACIHDGFVAFEGLRVDQTFLLYTLKSMESRLRMAGQTGSQANVNTDIVKALVIDVPPMSEQRAIGEALSDADRSVISLERLIAKKHAIKRGMMQQLLTGDIRLPGFSEPWSASTFERLAAPSKERAMPRSVSPEMPLIELEQIEAGSGRVVSQARASAAVSLKATFRPGDVLFGKLRAYLRKFWYADIGGLCTTEIWVLRPRAGIHGKFVRYVVETDRFIEAASGAYGTHMPRSDWSSVRHLPVGIPSHEEQVAIAAVLADVDGELDLLHWRLAKARDVKQGMMQELLSGRTRLPAAGVAA